MDSVDYMWAGENWPFLWDIWRQKLIPEVHETYKSQMLNATDCAEWKQTWRIASTETRRVNLDCFQWMPELARRRWRRRNSHWNMPPVVPALWAKHRFSTRTVQEFTGMSSALGNWKGTQNCREIDLITRRRRKRRTADPISRNPNQPNFFFNKWHLLFENEPIRYSAVHWLTCEVFFQFAVLHKVRRSQSAVGLQHCLNQHKPMSAITRFPCKLKFLIITYVTKIFQPKNDKTVTKSDSLIGTYKRSFWSQFHCNKKCGSTGVETNRNNNWH